MINYQVINGVSLDSATALPRISRTPEGIAMGAIPGWAVFVDPAYATSQGVRNRAQPSSVPEFSNDALLSSINESAAFEFTEEQFATLQAPISGDINPERWTAFFVTSELTENPFTSRQEIISPVLEESGVVCLRIILTEAVGEAVSVYENSVRSTGQPIRISYDNAELSDAAPSLLMCTFSVERGLSIWRNGEQVAVNSDDKRPLTFGTGGSDYEMFHYRRGKQGMTGVLNIDLSAPENSGHRRAIEKFVMNKYGIPEGV